MQEVFEKIIEKLEEAGKTELIVHGGRCNGKTLALGYAKGISEAIEIVKQVGAANDVCELEQRRINMTDLDKAIKVLTEEYEKAKKIVWIRNPIWKDVDKELPECEGIYYGKEDDTNSMWKVIFRNNEWYLFGYPEHKIDVIKWTELY